MKVRSTREQPSVGIHLARVLSIIDIGHQPGFTWSGGEVDSSYKYDITYELTDEHMEDGRPFVISEEVTNSDSDRGTLKVRCQATKTTFDTIDQMVGKPVMVTLEKNPKGYVKIAGQGGVSGCPLGMDVPALVNDSFSFDMHASHPDLEVYDKIWAWKQDKIKNALNFKETQLYQELLKRGDDLDEE